MYTTMKETYVGLRDWKKSTLRPTQKVDAVILNCELFYVVTASTT